MLGTLSYVISANIQPLKQALSSAVSNTQSASKAIGVSMQSIGDHTKAVSDQTHVIGQVFGQTSEDVRQAAEDMASGNQQAGLSFADLAANVGSTAAQLEEARDGLKRIEDDIKDIESALARSAPGKHQQELKQELIAANKALKEQKVIVGELETESKKASDGLKNMAQSAKMPGAKQQLDGLSQGIGAISPAAGQAVGGLQKAAVASKALMVAMGPVGLIAAAVGAAIGALTAYFRGSVDGQEKMAKIMGTLSGVMAVLKDAAIAVGRWLVWAFENPKEAIAQLWEAIKQNLVNRFNGMVEMVVAGFQVISKGGKGAALAIQGIFDKSKRDEAAQYFSEMRTGMADFGKAYIKAMTGIEDPLAVIAGVVDKINEKAKDGTNIGMREIALRKKQIEAGLQIARLEAEIAEARRISHDESYSTAEQIIAQEKAMELINQKMSIQQGLASEALSLQRAKMDLGENSLDDYEKEAQLQEQLIGLATQRDQELRSLSRRYSTLINQQQTELDAERKKMAEMSTMREGILEEIRKAGRTEVEVLQETMAERLSVYQQSADNELQVMRDKMQRELASSKLTEAERAELTEQWTQLIAARQLEITEETEAGRLAIVEYYTGQIQNIEQDAIDESLRREREKQSEIESIMQSGMDRVTNFATGLQAIAEQQQKIMDAIADGANTEVLEATLDAMIEKLHEVTSLAHLAEQAFMDFGQSVMQAGINATGGMKEFGKTVLQIVKKNIAALIAEGVAGAVSRALTSVPFPFNLAAAGAAGGLAAAAFNSLVPKLAEGATIPPGYDGDTYPAFLSSGETVMPPKKLDSIMQVVTGIGKLVTSINKQPLLPGSEPTPQQHIAPSDIITRQLGDSITAGISDLMPTLIMMRNMSNPPNVSTHTSTMPDIQPRQERGEMKARIEGAGSDLMIYLNEANRRMEGAF